VTPDGIGRDVWYDLVGGLLDARDDPATARFDAELAAGLADGTLTEDAAHRLRYWQRASVRSFADHARTVVPVALGALAAARHEAERYADEAAAVLRDAQQVEQAGQPEQPEPSAEPDHDEAERPDRPAGPPDPWHPTGPEPGAGPEPRVALVDLGALEAARRASAPEPPRPTTLEVRRPRLLVAGLTTAPVGPDRTS
jgi:hypothetical protein